MTYPSFSASSASASAQPPFAYGQPPAAHGNPQPAATTIPTAGNFTSHIPAASGDGYFQDTREQFAQLLRSLDELADQTAPAFRTRVVEFLRAQGHELRPVLLESTEKYLDAACNGCGLPDASVVEGVSMRALVCKLPVCADWAPKKRGQLQQALLAAFDVLEAEKRAALDPGLSAADRCSVEGHLSELLADPNATIRPFKCAALHNILKRYGYAGGVKPDGCAWVKLKSWTRGTVEPTLGLPQLLGAIETMPAHKELHARLGEALHDAIVAHARQWKAGPAAAPPVAPAVPAVIAQAAPPAAVHPVTYLDEFQRDRFEAIWQWMEGNVEPAMSRGSRHVYRPAGSTPSYGDAVLHRGGSGTRMAVQSARQSCSKSTEEKWLGLALLRNPDGTIAMTLDGQLVTDAETLQLLLRAAETFQGRSYSPPPMLLDEALTLLGNATGPDIAQKARAAQLALAGLLSVDVPPQPAPLVDGALPVRDPQALLALLPFAGSRDDLQAWIAAFLAGMQQPEDVIAQARVDLATSLALAQAPDPDLLRFYARSTLPERNAVVDQLLTFADGKKLFCLSTLFWRAKPHDRSGTREDSHGTLEYGMADGHARLTDMLCELRQAFIEDPAFVATCEDFAEAYAMGCTDRATIGLAGLGLLLNWWKVRADQVRALQALRALVNFQRMVEGAATMVTAAGESTETAEAGLRLMITARTKHLLPPDNGPRYLRHVAEEGTKAATPERMDAALKYILEVSSSPVLSTPLIQMSLAGVDYLQRNLGPVAPADLDRLSDELERVLAPFSHLSLLPALVNTPLTLPVLRRLLFEMVTPPADPPTPVQRQLRRLGGAVTYEDGVSASRREQRMRRGLIGEVIDAIVRQDPAFAAAIAGRLKTGDSLQAQCAALADVLKKAGVPAIAPPVAASASVAAAKPGLGQAIKKFFSS